MSGFEKPMIAVDLLVFTIKDDRLKLVLVQRGEEPFKGQLALPGVFVRQGETLDAAAQRGVAEEAGLKGIYFEQLYTWGSLERDPRSRIISVSYLSLVDSERITLNAGERTSATALYDVEELLSSDTPIAFDHREMIAYGRERIKNKTEYTRIAFEFLPEEFTLPQLQRVYEILLGKPLYKANFRRKIAPLIEDTNKMTSGDAHRPSKYYRQKPE
ncbi:8-oxo-dGTP diphosphatase [Ruminococcus sp. YE71]|uniref:NUDIX hydrolase n=1 Tax=unclassified Ruminococcus TaxID=2608920 RepID=UPI0008925657|nr:MULTISPECIES: NUDIX domain-containing protein [unclassified Ruminococcus]SDA22125.1 8-oxo-dGTP diphosphatase [Ruminococcus sp. YE78]SFW37496.1 8-oxo-dGTP diphosphatase [Ruminococcus sp. YE71]